jgi:hypothetical protein
VYYLRCGCGNTPLLIGFGRSDKRKIEQQATPLEKAGWGRTHVTGVLWLRAKNNLLISSRPGGSFSGSSSRPGGSGGCGFLVGR